MTLKGCAVAPRTPTTEAGLYWGYQTRLASGLRAVFDECPYAEGYDAKLGTSERGEMLYPRWRIPKFKHLLIVFGGPRGLEGAVNYEASGFPWGSEPQELFDHYVNVCPQQTSRTVRTEEALLIALGVLRPRWGT